MKTDAEVIERYKEVKRLYDKNCEYVSKMDPGIAQSRKDRWGFTLRLYLECLEREMKERGINKEQVL